MVQQLLSEAVDREPVRPELLAEARAHCRECPECARFVRGLALVERAEPPAPSAALYGRVVDAVAAEREALLSQRADEVMSVGLPGAAAAVDEAISASVSETELKTAEPVSETVGMRTARRRRRRDPWRTAAWLGAAAVVLVAVGFAAVLSTRDAAQRPATSSQDAFVNQEGTPERNAARSMPGDARPGEEKASGTAERAAAPEPAPAAPDFITVNGVAYRSVETSGIDESELTAAGSTSTSLDTKDRPKTYTVHAIPTTGRVAILTDTETLTFDVVTRRLGDKTYMLTSRPIERFGTWPSLPSGFTQPTTADGAPTFVEEEKDALGVQVYIRPGIPIENGFAVAPGTPSSDPAQGNPNWTWWSTSAE